MPSVGFEPTISAGQLPAQHEFTSPKYSLISITNNYLADPSGRAV